MQDLHGNPVHLRLSGVRAGYGRLLPGRRGLHLRADVHLHGLPARDRAEGEEPLKPDLPQQPATPFGVLMVLSFTATTVGYGGAAWYVAQAIVHAARG